MFLYGAAVGFVVCAAIMFVFALAQVASKTNRQEEYLEMMKACEKMRKELDKKCNRMERDSE